jgi:hypothetical protein
MELLLNLVWLTLALLAFSAFARKRLASSWTSPVPYRTAMLALACVLVLLFPVVSASDDLHPTQALLEDATKRIQQLTAPVQHNQFSPAAMAQALLAIYLLGALVALRAWRPVAFEAQAIQRARRPRAGRSPPSL